MSVTIETDTDVYTGKSVASIVRREFGRRAEVIKAMPSDSTMYGLVVTPSGVIAATIVRAVDESGAVL